MIAIAAGLVLAAVSPVFPVQLCGLIIALIGWGWVAAKKGEEA